MLFYSQVDFLVFPIWELLCMPPSPLVTKSCKYHLKKIKISFPFRRHCRRSWHRHEDWKARQKEPRSRHLPVAAREAPRVSGQMNASIKQVVLKRLFMGHTNRSPLSLSRMIQRMKLLCGENKRAMVGDSPTRPADFGSAQAEDVCTVGEQPTEVASSKRGKFHHQSADLESPEGHGTRLLSSSRKG